MELINLVKEEEIFETLDHFNPNKAPSLDGFMTHFYKKCETIIKFDLVHMIQYVHK
jgi:hypothetical protein